MAASHNNSSETQGNGTLPGKLSTGAYGATITILWISTIVGCILNVIYFHVMKKEVLLRKSRYALHQNLACALFAVMLIWVPLETAVSTLIYLEKEVPLMLATFNQCLFNGLSAASYLSVISLIAHYPTFYCPKVSGKIFSYILIPTIWVFSLAYAIALPWLPGYSNKLYGYYQETPSSLVPFLIGIIPLSGLAVICTVSTLICKHRDRDSDYAAEEDENEVKDGGESKQPGHSIIYVKESKKKKNEPAPPAQGQADTYDFIKKWNVDIMALQMQLSDPKSHGGDYPFPDLGLGLPAAPAPAPSTSNSPPKRTTSKDTGFSSMNSINPSGSKDTEAPIEEDEQSRGAEEGAEEGLGFFDYPFGGPLTVAWLFVMLHAPLCSLQHIAIHIDFSTLLAIFTILKAITAFLTILTPLVIIKTDIILSEGLIAMIYECPCVEYGEEAEEEEETADRY